MFPQFRTSSLCKADSDMCVGVAVGQERVAALDTKNPDQSTQVTFSREAFSRFVSSL